MSTRGEEALLLAAKACRRANLARDLAQDAQDRSRAMALAATAAAQRLSGHRYVDDAWHREPSSPDELGVTQHN